MMLLQWKKFYQIMMFVRAKLLLNFIHQDFNPWAAASLPWVELFFSDVTVGLAGSLPEGGPPTHLEDGIPGRATVQWLSQPW